jgi:hypothetical protein
VSDRSFLANAQRGEANGVCPVAMVADDLENIADPVHEEGRRSNLGLILDQLR